MKINVVANVRPHLGEGPLWDQASERLFWLDCIGGKIYRSTASGSELTAWDIGQPIGCIALRKSGGAVVALKSGFYMFDFENGQIECFAEPERGMPNNRMNDGKVDRAGRFFVGSMDATEAEPSGSLYRIEHDLKVQRIESGIKCSNGPCWSPDNTKFYFHDSWAGQTWVYDYDINTGLISNRQVLITHEGEGAPDGATVDSEGFLWIAKCFGGRIERYTPDGLLERTINMPVAKVTSIAFGGPDMDTLFVTSMAKPHLPEYSDDDGIVGGSVFSITGLGATGIPETRFAG